MTIVRLLLIMMILYRWNSFKNFHRFLAFTFTLTLISILFFQSSFSIIFFFFPFSFRSFFIPLFLSFFLFTHTFNILYIFISIFRWMINNFMWIYSFFINKRWLTFCYYNWLFYANKLLTILLDGMGMWARLVAIVRIAIVISIRY